VLAHLSAIENARREFASRNFPSVLQLCSIWLAKYPGHAVFAGLEREAEQRQKVTLIDEAKRRAAAEADLHKRLQMLEDALKEHPGEAGFEDEIRFTRNKLELVASIRGKRLEAHEQAGRLEAALERWASLATIYRNYPAWPRRRRGSTGKSRSSRPAPSPTGSSRSRRCWLASDVPAASDILRRALAEFPGVPQLAELGRRLAELRDRKARAQAALSEGRAACEKGRYQEGAARLRQAVELIRPTRHCARPW